MTKTIEVTVSTSGELKIDAVGFRGADCEAATKYLEEALGAVAQKHRKAEYSQRTTIKNQQKIG